MSAFSWSYVYIGFFLNTLSGGKSCSVAPGVAVPPWATETVLSPWMAADEARVSHVLPHVVWWKKKKKKFLILSYITADIFVIGRFYSIIHNWITLRWYLHLQCSIAKCSFLAVIYSYYLHFNSYHHHYHDVILLAQISMTLSRHLSLSSIAPNRSFRVAVDGF